MAMSKRVSQPRMPGRSRRQVSTRVIEEIDDRIFQIMDSYPVSYAYVVATILADALGIRKQPRYYTEATKRSKKRRG